jgi:hypothetical protein
MNDPDLRNLEAYENQNGDCSLLFKTMNGYASLRSTP